jgi:hypothetical protein
MKYFVCDRDEAIAELYSAFYFITSLRIPVVIQKEYPEYEFAVSDSIKQQLVSAYRQFVKAVVKEETSYKPLGIIRPGVLHVMKMLYQLQKRNKIAHVIIYSNNSSLLCLEFIRDVIHEYLGTTHLICECAHRNHPLRNERYAYDKTWSSLKHVLIEGNCKAPSTLGPEDVHFFDDLVHKDLEKALGKQYHQVPPYEFKASYERLAELYADALQNVSMLQFASLVAMVYGTSPNPITTSLQHILTLFKASTVQTASKDDVPPLYDKGIIMMKRAIYSLQNRAMHSLHSRTIHSLKRRAIKKRTQKRRVYKKSI